MDMKKASIAFDNHEAVLLKYKGEENIVHVPETIEGATLTAIGDGAFAGEPATEYMVKRKYLWEEEGTGVLAEEIVLPNTIKRIGIGAFARCQNLGSLWLSEFIKILSAYAFSDCRKLRVLLLPEGLLEIGEYALQNCRSLTEIILPSSLQTIGNYAFYNCRNLKRLKLSENIVSFGTGAFKNCEALCFIELAGHSNIQNVVADIHHEFSLSIKYAEEGGQPALLFFPEEACEYIEDYPARQFHQLNFGTGHLYRQCISNSDIDYKRYDQLFSVAKREESFDCVLTIAKYRLICPYHLPMDKKSAYCDFISENLLSALGSLFIQEDMKAVEALGRANVFTAENIDGAIHLAANKGKTAFASYLMDYRHRNFNHKNKSFAL